MRSALDLLKLTHGPCGSGLDQCGTEQAVDSRSIIRKSPGLARHAPRVFAQPGPAFQSENTAISRGHSQQTTVKIPQAGSRQCRFRQCRILHPHQTAQTAVATLARDDIAGLAGLASGQQGNIRFP